MSTKHPIIDETDAGLILLLGLVVVWLPFYAVGKVWGWLRRQ